MGRTSAPPLDGEAIRRARLRQFLTQAEVAAGVQARVDGLGIKFNRSGLSLIESGKVKRPSLKVLRALAEVLGLGPDEISGAEDDEADDEENAAA